MGNFKLEFEKMKLLASLAILKSAEANITCYSCVASRGADGSSLGVSDDRCFDETSGIQLVECDENAKYCISDLMVDWFAQGEQVATIRRGCAIEPEDTCEENEAENHIFQYRDCRKTCENSGDAAQDTCNGDMSVGDKIVENKIKDLSCHRCRYIEKDDGNINGNPKCEESLGIELQGLCPNYATAGCYTAASKHYLGQSSSSLKKHIYKGCSSWADRPEISYSYDFNETLYHVTKTACTSPNCNKEHLIPEKVFYCHTCAATFDTSRNELIFGDPKCFDDADNVPTLACSKDAIGCTTELFTDWFTKGDQTASVRRGCIEKESPQTCQSGASDRIMFRDCYDDCKDQKCNTDLKVAEKFPNGNQDTCKSCFYKETNNGEIYGNVNCANPEKSEVIESVACPRWANTGCYTGTAVHSYDGAEKDEVYKGCSSFEVEGLKEFEDVLEDGYAYAVSKETCKGKDCNKEHEIPEQVFHCYTCTATYDTARNQLIYGDPLCLEEPEATVARACSKTATGCSNEILTDWFTTGDQTQTIRRGCLEEPISEECSEGASDRIMFRDCYTTCDASRCNIGTDVAEKFPDGKQKSCHTCFYKEENDGTVSGNTNCPNLSRKNFSATSVECPRWANVGCYTGSAIHEYEGNWKNEVYKGCSSFEISGLHEFEDVLEDGYAYGITKETCKGDDCNKGHTTPKHPGQSAASALFASAFALFTVLFNL